ncbi:hypothetical protein TNCV_3486291 [Trichonephila clavipes]|nr:hypothetical protein TNCV_3486291 [Trichonephila clavipes]
MGSRTRGRPPTRWIDDVENDLKTLNIKNWQSCCVSLELEEASCGGSQDLSTNQNLSTPQHNFLGCTTSTCHMGWLALRAICPVIALQAPDNHSACFFDH